MFGFANSSGSGWLRALGVVGPAILVVGSAWPSAILTVFGLTLTGDRLLGLAAVPVLVAVALFGGLRWTAVHTALAALVGAQIVTSVLGAAAWPQGPKFATIYVLGFACFALAAEWARGAAGQRRMTLAWIIVGVAVSIVGALMANLANAYQRTLWGTQFAQVVSDGPPPVLLFGPQITMHEWNLFSSFLLVPFALMLWSWRREGRHPGLVAALAAAVLGIVSGITRAVWITAAALVTLWAWRQRPRPKQLAMLGVMVGAALLVQVLCLGTSPILKRGLQVSTVAGRAEINRATIEAWLRRPVFGHGAGSVNALEVGSHSRPAKVWTGNVVLFVLHDSGLIGLAALLALSVVVARRGWRSLRRGAGAANPSLALPLLACGAALAFAYQFTHGLWVMYPYVFLGFLTAATDPGEPGSPPVDGQLRAS